MCKIEFNDQEFRKIKRSNGIELLKFSIEKVLNKYGKWFLKMRGNPDISLHNTHIRHSAQQNKAAYRSSLLLPPRRKIFTMK